MVNVSLCQVINDPFDDARDEKLQHIDREQGTEATDQKPDIFPQIGYYCSKGVHTSCVNELSKS
jgi:hypothetical protein